MKDYDVYLFDLDGTLIDSEESMKDIFFSSYKEVGININESQIRHLMRVPLPVGYKENNGDEKLYPNFLNRIDAFLKSKESLTKTVLFSDVLTCLNKLKEKNKIIGIVTSNNKKHVLDVFEHFNIDSSIFSLIVGNQEAKRHKPHPDPILVALDMINYQDKKDKVCYIGDGINDMESSCAALVDGILLDRYNEYNDLEYKKINSLKEIINE